MPSAKCPSVFLGQVKRNRTTSLMKSYARHLFWNVMIRSSETFFNLSRNGSIEQITHKGPFYEDILNHFGAQILHTVITVTSLLGRWRLKSPASRLWPYIRCRSKKMSKLRVTGLCVGNSPMTGEFPAQLSASNAENVSIWWRHHVIHEMPTVHRKQYPFSTAEMLFLKQSIFCETKYSSPRWDSKPQSFNYAKCLSTKLRQSDILHMTLRILILVVLILVLKA